MKFQLLKQPVIGTNIPAAVFENLYSAKENDLKVILYVVQKGEIDVADISRNLQISITAITSSLLFWTDKGLILCEEEDSSLPKKKPVLTSRQILKISSENPEVEFMVNRIQKIYGHALNEKGMNAFLNLHLQENIPVEVILILAAHYGPVQKGPGYTARVIENLFNKQGVTSGEKAEQHIALMIRREKLYEKACRIFSLNKDKLTSSEKTIIAGWEERLGMGEDMIRAAFEAAGGNRNIKYCNGILKSWSQKKYTRPEDIQQEFSGFNLSGKNIDRQDDILLQGMNIVPVFTADEE